MRKILDQADSPQQVAILMGTFNGEKFLIDQLESIGNQTFRNWRLIVSDDGSTDSTIEILKKYQTLWGEKKLEIRQGQGIGFSENFLSLACDPKIKADYFAFSDQDDVWLPHKIECALRQMKDKSQITPLLYCGRTKYVNQDLKLLGLSPLFTAPTSFGNALVQSIAGGNTMLFNKALKAMLEEVGSVDVVSHDWWLYLLTTASGGHVYYDCIPYIFYRQHNSNLVGGDNSFSARLKRLTSLFRGDFIESVNRNLLALEKSRHLLSMESSKTLDRFSHLRASNVWQRSRMIGICGLYRQTKFGKISLVLASILGKI